MRRSAPSSARSVENAAATASAHSERIGTVYVKGTTDDSRSNVATNGLYALGPAG
jgi:hypothetical protein